jgi:hypothetical protein
MPAAFCSWRGWALFGRSFLFGGAIADKDGGKVTKPHPARHRDRQPALAAIIVIGMHPNIRHDLALLR